MTSKARSAKSGATTMDDIARLAGVAKVTVSRVLNGSLSVTDETRARVEKVAQQQGYFINRSAQRLRQKRSGTIAVVIDFRSLPNRRIAQPFHFELLADVFNALSHKGQDVLLVSPEHDDPSHYQAMLASKRVDG